MWFMVFLGRAGTLPSCKPSRLRETRRRFPNPEEGAEGSTTSEQELADTTLVAAALRAGGAMTHRTHTLE
jgi:hypothetical protein